MVNFEYYLESIVASTNDTEKIALDNPVSLKKIDEYSEQLKDLRVHVKNIEGLWKKRIRINKSLIEKQSPEYKKDIYHAIYNLNSQQILIRQKESVNEYIKVLSKYLKLLKVAIFKDDKESVQRIVGMFTTNKLNVSYLMTQVSEFKDNIQKYESSYNDLMSKLNQIHGPLESKISMVLSPKSPSYFKELYQSQKRQNFLIYHIGRNFINIVNNSYSKKEISKMISQRI